MKVYKAGNKYIAIHTRGNTVYSAQGGSEEEAKNKVLEMIKKRQEIMTQEDKELLLKDLCARLPYNCRVFYEYVDDLDGKTYGYSLTLNTWCIDEFIANKAVIKPYLRSMDAITEDETRELLFVRLSSKYGESCAYIKNFIKLNEISFRKEPPYVGSVAIWFSFENKIAHDSKIIEYSKCEYLGQINDITLAEIDWLNAHHFDYRGLIEKGLALEATDGMYNLKEK